jgi:hypothetical protein
MNQRWFEGRDSYRPPTERIRTSEYDVALMGSDLTARAFVESHHYSHSYPAARVRVGLYRRGELAGVAVFSHPCNDLVLTNTFGQVEAVELGRFVLLDEVPGNGETWFLARCFEQLRAEGFRGVVSFSDPMPRADVSGRVVFPGHIGTIYQAHNARYLGRSASRQRRLLPDGTVFNRRTEQKIRGAERGWRGAVEQLVGYGADSLGVGASFGDRIAWLETWRSRLTRSVRHPGNHRYAWPLNRRVVLPTSLLYPKAVAA